jgi:hypothetical protein
MQGPATNAAAGFRPFRLVRGPLSKLKKLFVGPVSHSTPLVRQDQDQVRAYFPKGCKLVTFPTNFLLSPSVLSNVVLALHQLFQ